MTSCPTLRLADTCPLSLTLWIFCFIDKEQNLSLEQKLTFIRFIVVDNFFKVALVYACVLLWNTNVISQISIENFIKYPKHSQIHFLTDTLLSSICLVGWADTYWTQLEGRRAKNWAWWSFSLLLHGKTKAPPQTKVGGHEY